MKIETDYHIHTVLSGHSAPDMLIGAILNAAEQRGLRRILIVEHVPEVGSDREAVLGGTLDRGHRPQIDSILEQVAEWQHTFSGEVLVGAEVDADPLAADGSLLLADLHTLDAVIGSTHYVTGMKGMWYELPEGLQDEKLVNLYEKWMIWAMNLAANENVDILAHPGAEMASLGAIQDFTGNILEDFEKLLRVCRKFNTAFELNELAARKIGEQRCASYTELFAMARDLAVPISISSDAHTLPQIGVYDQYVQKTVDTLGLRPGDLYHPPRRRPE